MTTVDQPPFRVIGTRPIRPDGVEKVTGKAQYGADVRLPGLVHGRVLRSPHAHARIVSIDTSAAAALPGVVAVVTAADFPLAADAIAQLGEGAVNLRELSDNVLASRKVLYKGHAVAAVAALSPHVAEQALDLIRVEYEPLTPVMDARDAMREDAPLLDDLRRTKSMAGKGDRPSNVASHTRFQGGDVVAAFAEADEVLEREFVTKTVHQGYIEPHNATASWNPDGTVTVWTSTQGAFGIRGQVCELLRLPANRVRVVPMEIGGGFGGKIPVYLEPLAVMLSKKSGRPVKITMNRAEEFQASGPTSATFTRIKLARQGDRLTACEATLAYEAGAYPGSPVGPAAMCMLAPYAIENFVVDAYDVCVNKPKVAPYRAPGAPTGAFAVETVIDEFARGLGVDPLEFRLRNASRQGTLQVTGAPFGVIGNEECVRAAATTPHYHTPIEGPNRGRGVASGFWFNGGFQSTVSVALHPDGTLTLIEGSVDIGGTRASLAMQLAEVLEVPYADIRPAVVDTDSIGHNDLTGGSRTTFATGLAVHKAGMELRSQLAVRAAKALSVPVDTIEYGEGRLWSREAPEKQLTLKDLGAGAARTGGPITATASVTATGVGGAFATHIVDVEVDEETGKIAILRYTAVQDVGRAVHPSYVEGQIQGAVGQGLGWALNEEYCYDDQGRQLNASFLDYRMPTAPDLPMIDTILVEVPNPGHPYGVRGVGEVPLVPPLAAVANAVYDAIGVRFTELPLSPRRVLETLHAGEPGWD
ncbi:MAG: xanthine dehydrogenase family protein molybdopterin-binding subunit [Dehalococcoidia bacterium]|nr:xanthine dehydrogenase family protein molybdopterin-binding subunit [Dehalococcoidia bacterium]